LRREKIVVDADPEEWPEGWLQWRSCAAWSDQDTMEFTDLLLAWEPSTPTEIPWPAAPGAEKEAVVYTITDKKTKRAKGKA
jgi:hypothetical protein